MHGALLVQEPTSPLGALGAALVFMSVGGLACARARDPARALPGARRAREGGGVSLAGEEPLKRADAAREAREVYLQEEGEAEEEEEDGEGEDAAVRAGADPRGHRSVVSGDADVRGDNSL